jgi:Flp pilus assembly protein TadG
MLRKNQPVQSFRKWRRHSEQRIAQKLALRWRSAFSAAINVLQSGTALASEVIRASFSESRQALPKKRKATSFSNDETVVASRPLWQRFLLLREAKAAALIEFAVALPLIAVLIVGIFDFGAAFNLKQKLNNAVREGARFGAAQPSNDLGRTNPPSVNAVRYLVDSYLQTAHINDCGLSTAPWALATSFTWVFTATTGCSMTLTVNRQFVVQETVGGVPVNMLCTKVDISYPYQWHFNNVIQLLVPGANYSLGNIPGGAIAVNVD